MLCKLQGEGTPERGSWRSKGGAKWVPCYGALGPPSPSLKGWRESLWVLQARSRLAVFKNLSASHIELKCK